MQRDGFLDAEETYPIYRVGCTSVKSRPQLVIVTLLH